MTTRRDFLASFAALASGLALAPASALAQVQRLGAPREWVEPVWVDAHVFYAARSGNWSDPETWAVCRHYGPARAHCALVRTVPRLPLS